MHAYLLTRGTPRNLDYAFLGSEPATHWWDRLSDANFINIDRFEVAARADGSGLSLLLSGLPSARRDSIGTPIRFTVVVDGLQDDPELLADLVAVALSPAGRAALGRQLDEEFPYPEINAIRAGTDPGTDIGVRTLRALRSGSTDEALAGAGTRTGTGDGTGGGTTADGGAAPAGRDGTDRTGCWVGPVDDPLARGAFLARVARMADGSTGFAFTSHALASVAGAQRAAETLGADAVILLHDGGPAGIQPLGKAPAGTAGGSWPRPALIVLLSLAGLAIALLIRWLIRWL
ncbi:hypothetical protein EDC02_3594 [Micromonospora sp. Llam0]|uniref:hypothetical protein n=1 Tax=Micromonospora sp. Llam0 TaxID=2485143 RepID=UPI000F98CFB8|nr:hypothetical protein [Micromonospora sp. Llam0]ROO61645.1 hypothetical protein EDC02_3594 [Micromonospora sp. Llam0]